MGLESTPVQVHQCCMVMLSGEILNFFLQNNNITSNIRITYLLSVMIKGSIFSNLIRTSILFTSSAKIGIDIRALE